MRRVLGEAKRRLWRERLGRFACSGKKVAVFCSAERVSVPSFYQWKRMLAAESVRRRRRRGESSSSMNRAARSMSVKRAGAFLPVRIEGATLAELDGRIEAYRTYDAIEVALYHTPGKLPGPTFTHEFGRGS